jgi:FKBP12-rapamycin complex-associated protein
MDIIDNPEQSQIQVQSSLIRSIMLDNFLNICNQVFQYRQQPKSMIANVLIRILPRLASLNYKLFSHQPYVDATMNFIIERLTSKELKERQLAFHALGLMILADKTSRINDTDSLITTTPLTKDMTKILECLKQTFIPISSSSSSSSINSSITSTHSHRRNNSTQSTNPSTSSSSGSQQQQQQQQLAMNSLLPCRYLSPDSSVFACITMIGEAGPDASKCLDILLEYLLHCGLNHSLLFCLDKLCSMPLIHTDTKRKIHQGLLENLRLILCNSLSYSTNLTIEQIDMILITLQILRIFDFEAQAIEPFFIDILNTRFIEHDIVRIRIESIITITHLLRRLLSPPSQTILSSNTTTSLTAANKLRIKIGHITQRILTIGVTDLDPDVRYNVFLTLQDDFKQFLAKSEALELLFFSVHDECHEIRELALSLIGRLSNINPAYVLPPLRHLLLQLLTELEIGCSLSGKEQASRLLGQLIANTPRIVRPYMQSITQALLPLIKQHEQHSNVLIALVRTVGEQAQVCGIDLDQRIHDLFPILINMMQDTSNYRKREVALWTIGQIVESCCYVIEPLQKYPILLDVLLQFLKSPEETPFRRETIRVLGFLGAIDPYHVRSSNDPLRSLSFDVNDITLTHRVRFEPDPIEISSNELLVASGAQSLHDFYTSMAIYVCLRVLKDPNTPQLHLKAVQAISIILQWLGNICTQYVALVLPRLLSVVRNTDDRNLVPYFRQINIIIISIKSSIIDYVNDVVQLIRDYWDTHSDLQILLIQTIESLAAALDSEFRHYIHLLLPFVMKTFRIDTNNINLNTINQNQNQNQDRQLILSQMFSTLNKFGKTLKPHFNVVLPSILDIASTNTYPIKLRQEALDTIEQLADKVYLSDYVSAILQILLRIIRKTQQLQMKCLDIILIIAQQMGKHFLVFSSLVLKTMDDMKLQHSKYELYISKLKDSSFADVQTETIINSNHLLNQLSSNEQTKKTDEKMLYTIRTEQLRQHWLQAMQRNAKDLPMWLNKFQQLVLEQSPVYPLRAMGTCLAQVSPSIPRDLFNASFISCWSELNFNDRQSLTNALTYVLTKCDKPDVIQIILNLAEFRNHCDLKLKLERQQKGNKRNDEMNLNDTNDDIEKDKNINKKDSNYDSIDDDSERSLININLLSEKAFSVRAYAKALRYKEEEFQKQHDSLPTNQTASITSDIVESLISINHELQQSEAAYGALQFAKHNNIKIKGLWYEKLNQWERALRNYEFLKTNDQANMDIHLGRMRCMQALGSWTELKDLACQVWDLTEQIRDEQLIIQLPFTTSLIDKNSANTGLNPSHGTVNGRELKKNLQQKIAPMATRAAWSLGDMTDMEKYYIHIPDTKFEGAYYRAVDAIRNDNYRQAQDSIDLARELLDVELTTLANESYNRAYSGIFYRLDFIEDEKYNSIRFFSINHLLMYKFSRIFMIDKILILFVFIF